MPDIWTKTGLDFVDPEEKIEIPRETLVAAVHALGGPAFSDRATDEQIIGALRNCCIGRMPESIIELDAALLEPCSVPRRAKLMARRIELDQAAKAAPGHALFPK